MPHNEPIPGMGSTRVATGVTRPPIYLEKLQRVRHVLAVHNGPAGAAALVHQQSADHNRILRAALGPRVDDAWWNSGAAVQLLRHVRLSKYKILLGYSWLDSRHPTAAAATGIWKPTPHLTKLGS